MYRAVIFDLDNCLSAGAAVGRAVMEPVFSAIADHNHGHFSEADLEAIDVDLWRLPLHEIFSKHDFPAPMRSASWTAYSRLQVTRPMLGYDDINVLPELPVMRFLVTTGFRSFQESKIRALGIGPLFVDIRIDDVEAPEQERGKQAHFAAILDSYRLAPAEVMVVGDNAESEIVAGNNLGLTTVQILRPGVPRGTNANFYIEDLWSLRKLILRDPTGRCPPT